uniref:Uncharacterized protein n=1 Tax=Chromera velia CCMP2878 TaxID=1169474 RepID=A0A0G4HVY8_9ALVE|eukprot:Cvel_8950.t1-p1 / transcript=Cvel_8950.t1 / gene=Cvel_8950 / organism=Chromera_velia_CCMP2878 / gene_product=hypothetical protein / transcript_product=hypothetical protein / location=Cvel_scaffold504:43130-49561(+) / protein_length=1145 / sequence_SO=supercontig / SO=protein_coding / is_pseudo=false
MGRWDCIVYESLDCRNDPSEIPPLCRTDLCGTLSTPCTNLWEAFRPLSRSPDPASQTLPTHPQPAATTLPTLPHRSLRDAFDPRHESLGSPFQIASPCRTDPSQIPPPCRADPLQTLSPAAHTLSRPTHSAARIFGPRRPSPASPNRHAAATTFHPPCMLVMQNRSIHSSFLAFRLAGSAPGSDWKQGEASELKEREGPVRCSEWKQDEVSELKKKEGARVPMGSSKAEEVGCKARPRCGAGARCGARLGCRAGEGCRAGVHCRAGEGCRAGVQCRAGERYRAGEECGAGDGCRAGEGCRAGVQCRAGERYRAGEECGAGEEWTRARAEIQRVDGTSTVVGNPRGPMSHSPPEGGGPGRRHSGGAGGCWRGVEPAGHAQALGPGLEQLLGGRDGCAANLALDLQNAHFRDGVRGGEPFEDTSVVAEWALSKKTKNRLAHAYNGNSTAQVQAVCGNCERQLLTDGTYRYGQQPCSGEGGRHDYQPVSSSAAASGSGSGKAGRSVSKKSWKPPSPKDIANVRLVPNIEKEAPETFVGASGWLPDKLEWVKKRLEQGDDVDPSGPRVSLGVLSRFARGGKTRALIELGKKLQKEIPDCLVIFISLNDKTKYESGSSGLSGVGEVVMRIAWVLDGCWKDREKKQDMFTKFCKEQTWKKESFEKWLGSRKVILLVDELNQLPLSAMGEVGSDDNLPSFLSKNFIASKGRALVFTTHVASTASTFTRLLTATEQGSNRECIFLGLPLIENFKEDTTALGKFWNASKILYYGRSPGLVVTPEEEVDMKFYRRFNALKGKERQKALRAVIETALKGGRTEEIGSLEGLADVRVTSNRSTSLLWPPCYLSQVVKKIEGLERAANLLDMLRDGQTNDGKAWEGVVAAAIAMRLWLSRGTDLLPALKRTEIGCIIDDDAQSTTVADVLNRHASSLKSTDRVTSTHLIVSWHDQFVGVDVLLVKEGCQRREVWGYQCKQGERAPESHPPEGLNKAIWLQACARQETTFSQGWEIPSEKRIEELLSVSLSEVAPQYWRALVQSKPPSAAAVGSSAAAGANSGSGGGGKGKRKKGELGDAAASASSSAGANSGGGGGGKGKRKKGEPGDAAASASSSAGDVSLTVGGGGGDRKRQLEHGGDDADTMTQGEGKSGADGRH